MAYWLLNGIKSLILDDLEGQYALLWLKGKR